MEKAELDPIVQKLVGWLLKATDHFADGDLEAEELENLANIIREIPSTVEVPEEIWIY